MLKAEGEVNKKVSEALNNKYIFNYANSNRNNLLKSIKEQAEKDLAQYRIDKEAEYQRELERVSSRQGKATC